MYLLILIFSFEKRAGNVYKLCDKRFEVSIGFKPLKRFNIIFLHKLIGGEISQAIQQLWHEHVHKRAHFIFDSLSTSCSGIRVHKAAYCFHNRLKRVNARLDKERILKRHDFDEELDRVAALKEAFQCIVLAVFRRVPALWDKVAHGIRKLRKSSDEEKLFFWRELQSTIEYLVDYLQMIVRGEYFPKWNSLRGVINLKPLNSSSRFYTYLDVIRIQWIFQIESSKYSNLDFLSAQ